MDPAVFKSEKTGRGPLGPNWKVQRCHTSHHCDSTRRNNILSCRLPFALQEELANNSSCPHMCAYKLATVEAKFFPLTGKVEGVIQRVQNSRFPKWSGTFWDTRRPLVANV